MSRAAHDRLYRERHRDAIVQRARARRQAKAEANGYARRLWGRDDDDRGLRRLLADLGLPKPPPPPSREIVRLLWLRVGVSRAPLLAAVVRLPSIAEHCEVSW